jgi:hypothetical protein
MAGADALDEADPPGALVVAGTDEVSRRRATGADQPLELHRRDDVLEAGIAVLIQFGGVVDVGPDGDDDRADLAGDQFVLVVEIDGLLLAHIGALPAGDRVVPQAVFHIQDVGTGNRLGEGDVDGMPRGEPHLVLVRVDRRADLGAFPARVADLDIDVTGLLPDGRPEVPHVPRDTLDLAEGQKLYVRMPTGIDGLRPQNSYGAVHRRVRLVELGHDPADGGLLLHQHDLVSRLGQL